MTFNLVVTRWEFSSLDDTNVKDLTNLWVLGAPRVVGRYLIILNLGSFSGALVGRHLVDVGHNSSKGTFV